MPIAYINTLHKKGYGSIKTLEKKWAKAKHIAKSRNYAVITAVFKNLVGIKENRMSSFRDMIEAVEKMEDDKKYYRLAHSVIGNNLYSVKNNLNTLYLSLEIGNDVDIKAFDAIIKELKFIRSQVYSN